MQHNSFTASHSIFISPLSHMPGKHLPPITISNLRGIFYVHYKSNQIIYLLLLTQPLQTSPEILL